MVGTLGRKNIGVKCNEIIIENDDCIEKIKNEIATYETEYTVVKIPVKKIDIMLWLQEMNFFFIEMTTSCQHIGNSFNLNRIQQRIIDSLNYEEMSEMDVDYMYGEIRNCLFTTDRIAVDPYFTLQQANNRYINWIKDELKSGAKSYRVSHNQNQVGFFILKKNSEREWFAFLGGLYSSYLESGFGFSMNYFEVIEGQKLGAKRILTSFSSNNRGAAAIHLNLGYNLLKQYYIFVKHKH